MKCRMAFMYAPYDLRIEERDLSDLAPYQILIKVKACGICGSDLECYQGHSDEGRYDIAPYTPGHEWAGMAVKTGSAVTSVKVGDKVVGDCVLPCNNCANCKDGLMPSVCLNMREVGFRPDSPGGMGEYMVLEEQYTHVIPSDWDYELGAWVEAFNVGYWGVWGNGCAPDASDDVLIIGGGPIGITACMVASTSGANVILVDPVAARRSNALKYGADHTLDPILSSYSEELTMLTGGRGPSVVLECSGSDSGIASVFDIAGPNCRVGLIGQSVGRKIPLEIGKTLWKNMSISGSAGTKNWFPRTIRFMSRIRDRFDFSGLISHRFAFEDVKDAFDFAINNKDVARKVMLKFE